MGKRVCEITGRILQPSLSEAAASLGKKGGPARARALSPERRAEIARKAAQKRWNSTPWRTGDTAPKDGTPFIAQYAHLDRPVVAWWSRFGRNGGGWVVSHSSSSKQTMPPSPEYWMPMPELPSTHTARISENTEKPLVDAESE